MEVAEQMISKRIRELRQVRRLTLQQVADRAGISKSFLSKVEHCNVSISVATLSRLAAALSVPLGEFFQDDDSEGEVIYVPRGGGRSVTGRNSRFPYQYEVLIPLRGNRQMGPILITIDGHKTNFELREHPGDQFIYMLEGEMNYVCGNKQFRLVPGDCLYFPGQMPHGAKLRKNQRARYLVVLARENSSRH